jgi:transposase
LYVKGMTVAVAEQDVFAENKILFEANAALVERVKHQEEQLAELKQQLDWFKRQLFGEKSERVLKSEPLHEGQLHLGEQFEQEVGREEAAGTVVSEHVRKKRKKEELPGTPEDSGLRFDESVVPVETIFVPNPDTEGLSSEEYEIVDERATYRLGQRQGPYVVLKYVQPVVKLKESGAVCTPEAPPSVFEGSLADVSFLVGLLVDKFVWHMPLYRQHQRLAAAGIKLSRTTLTNYVHRLGDLLEPIYTAHCRSVLTSKVLALDETPTKVGRKKKKPGKMNRGYFWPAYGDKDEVAFFFRENRSGKWLEELLSGFTGTLLSDGYGAYERYAKRHEEMTHAQCWSHARRAIEKAKNAEPALTEKVLLLFAKLWTIEEEINKQELTGEAKKHYRKQHSAPVVADILTVFQFYQERRVLLPSNPFSKGVNYLLKRKEALQVFLENPDVPLDTNHLERELKPIPMGRKAWLFCWTEVGAKYTAIFQSLLVTCRLQGIDPYTYLVDVLQRLDQHPMSEIDKLIPRNWKEHFGDDPIPEPIAQAQNNG